MVLNASFSFSLLLFCFVNHTNYLVVADTLTCIVTHFIEILGIEECEKVERQATLHKLTLHHLSMCLTQIKIVILLIDRAFCHIHQVIDLFAFKHDDLAHEDFRF